MKTRQGFVSNSSTSSYIIITTKEKYDTTLSRCHPYVKAVMEALEPTESKLGKESIVVISYNSGNQSTFEYLDVPYEGKTPCDMEGPWEAVEDFEEKLGKVDVVARSEYF
jgi:hypothetical protein